MAAYKWAVAEGTGDGDGFPVSPREKGDHQRECVENVTERS